MPKLWGRVNGAVGSIGNWATVIGVATGGYAWLSSRATLFDRFNWADRVFFGLACVFASGLLVSIGLVAWRIFRPIPGSTAILWKSESYSTLEAPPLIQVQQVDYAVQIEQTSKLISKLVNQNRKIKDSLVNALAAGKVFYAQLQREKAGRLISYINSMEVPKPGRFQIVYDGFWLRAFSQLGGSSNINIDFLGRCREQAQKEIVSNAIFCVLNEGDKWPTPEDKQKWHVHKRLVELLQVEARRLQSEFDAAADPELAIRSAKTELQ